MRYNQQSNLHTRIRFLKALFFLLAFPLCLGAQSIDFSANSGIYPESIFVNLTASNPIYYTIDGSIPNTYSPVYTSPIEIDHSLTLRAITYDDQGDASDVQTEAYLIGVQHTMPIVYLAFDPKDFFDPLTGIYPNYTQDWEAKIEVIYFKTDGTLAFKQPAKAEIQGSASAVFPHKSLSIKSKKYNGKKLFDYPIFENLPNENCGSFIMRNSGQDWDKTFFRDAYAASMVQDLSDVGNIIDKPLVRSQGYQPAIAYFNGEYRGLYNLRERFDKRYFESYFGWKKNEDYDLIKDGNTINVVKSGDSDDWFEYMNFIQNDMSIPANYDSLKSIMAVEEYIDYIAFNVFINNHDWPANNVRRYKKKEAGAKWHWMSYDLDFSLSLFNEGGIMNSGMFYDNALQRLHNGLAYTWPSTEWSTRPFRACIQNPEWRTQFINRMADQLNTLYQPSRLQARLDSFHNTYLPEVPEHMCKWFQCFDIWESNVNKISTFVNGRTPVVRQHIVQQYNEVTGTSNVTITSNPIAGGTVEFSTINLDETTMPWTGIYFKGVEIPVKVVPSPGYEFVGWSEPALSDNTEGKITIYADTYNLVANFQLIPESFTISCPDNIYFSSGTNSAFISWPLPVVESSNCPTVELTQIEGLPNESNFPLGSTVITYEATGCEDTVSCSFSVNVEAINYDLTITCPDDINVSTTEESTIASWDTPILITNCPTVELTQIEGLPNESNFSIGSTIITYEATGCEDTVSCNFNINVIQDNSNQGCGPFLGYTKLGVFNQYGYYISNSNSTWPMANQASDHMMLTIQNQEENDYIKSIVKEPVFIGLNDEENEGTFVWEDQSPVNYTNFAQYAWVGLNTPENDYGTFLPWDGKWSFGNQWNQRPHLIKKECANTTVTPVEDCPTELDGYTYWGQYNNHVYFLSENIMTWQQANDAATAIGGNLATINSYDENLFLLNLNTEMIFIGYHDSQEEGVGAWANGEAVTVDYSEYNSENADFAVMNFWNGNWGMVNQYVHKKFLIEFDCNADNQSTETNGDGIKLISINPNPTFDNIILHLTAVKEETIQTTIYNANGQKMGAQKHQIKIGRNNIEFDLLDLPPGVYFLRVTGQLTDQTLRFVKLRW